MMFIRQLSSGKKRLVLIISLVIALLLIVIGIWIGLALHARNQFVQALQTYSTSAKQQLTTQAAQFEALNKTPNAAESLNRITQSEQLATKLLREVPLEPRLVGIGVATAESQDQASTMRQWLFDLQRATQQSKQFITYKTEVMTIIKELTGKQGTTLDEQKALVAAWKDAHAKLKAITPPDHAVNVHGQLVSSVESISATMASLPELFEKKDRAGFVAKQQELESKISGLRTLGETYQLLGRDLDKAIATPLKALTS